MKILFLTLLLLNSAFASIAKYYAMGQPFDGSFYLSGDRNHYRNPAKLFQTPEGVYLESEAEAGIKKDNWLIALSDKRITGAYQINDVMGAEAFISALNGHGVKAYGATFGIDLFDYAFYTGLKDRGHGPLMPLFGGTFNLYNGTLFAEYQGHIFHVPGYEFTLGYGKEYEMFFGDITYNQINIDKCHRSLIVTIGGKMEFLENWLAMASVRKDLYFHRYMNIAAGVEWTPSEKLEFGLSHSLLAFGKKKPLYEDFDIIASAAYRF